jgi:hypothetical protein
VNATPPPPPPRPPLPPAQTQTRLDQLRGRALPVNHNARTISALAANPGCSRRALMDAAGVDKQQVAMHVGFPAPFGQSQFAIIRGNAFEAQVKEGGAAQLLTLLREHLGLDIEQAHYHDLNDVGGNDAAQVRHGRTRQLLTSAARSAPGEATGTMFDHPLLRLAVGGRHAYLEPDLIALHHRGRFHVVEIKSFAIIDGQADPARVAAAAIQSAVYVHALRDLLGGDPDQVHYETILVAPRDFSSQPTAAAVDVRRQLTVLRRQLERIGRIEDLLGLYPADLTFDLDPDAGGQPRRPPGELAGAIGQVAANYAPECLATCELCFLCRDEAAGTTGALGKSVRTDLGGLEHTGQVLGLARGTLPPPPERAEIAARLTRAAALRAQFLPDGGLAR